MLKNREFLEKEFSRRLVEDMSAEAKDKMCQYSILTKFSWSTDEEFIQNLKDSPYTDIINQIKKD